MKFATNCFLWSLSITPKAFSLNCFHLGCFLRILNFFLSSILHIFSSNIILNNFHRLLGLFVMLLLRLAFLTPRNGIYGVEKDKMIWVAWSVAWKIARRWATSTRWKIYEVESFLGFLFMLMEMLRPIARAIILSLKLASTKPMLVLLYHSSKNSVKYTISNIWIICISSLISLCIRSTLVEKISYFMIE